jgi:hypothetical protein
MARAAEIHHSLVLDGVQIEAFDPCPGNYDSTPRVRVWMNEALIHNEDGECAILNREETEE